MKNASICNNCRVWKSMPLKKHMKGNFASKTYFNSRSYRSFSILSQFIKLTSLYRPYPYIIYISVSKVSIFNRPVKEKKQ